VNAFNLSAWAVKHKPSSSTSCLAVAAAGLYAYLGMGRAEDPPFTIKTMVVSVDWPGATSDEVQRQVADKIEEKLQETPYLDYLRTYSLPGKAVVTVQLRNDTPPKAVPDIWYQVRKKVGDIKHTLPEGVTGPSSTTSTATCTWPCTPSPGPTTPRPNSSGSPRTPASGSCG
jgi:Cation/multidrug efflux pump